MLQGLFSRCLARPACGRASRRLAMAVSAGALVAACATPPVQLEPRMSVVNRTSLVISELRYRPCGSTTELWQNLATVPLSPGQAALFDFPLPCSDLNALYADGRSAGNQTGIKQKFPFRWDIY